MGRTSQIIRNINGVQYILKVIPRDKLNVGYFLTHAFILNPFLSHARTHTQMQTHTPLYCLPKGRHSDGAHEFQGSSSQKCSRGGVGVGWGGGGVGHVGVGWGGSCRGGVGWVMQGWGGSCRGGVGHAGVGWGGGGVGHVGVGWGGSCRGGVGHVGVGWAMHGWGGVGVGWVM